MELEITKPNLNVFNPHNINEKSKVNLFPGRIGGDFSNRVTFNISVRDAESEETDGWVSFDLNRNQALYVIKFLHAFISEKEIDIKAED